VTKVKSKIDCRGNSKTATPEFTNINPKKFQRIDEFGLEENILTNDFKNQNIPMNKNFNNENNNKMNHYTKSISSDNTINNINKVKKPYFEFNCFLDLENKLKKINNFSSMKEKFL